MSLVGVQPEHAVPRVVRIRYSKLGKIRFTSHRDVGRMWERALRRIVLAVAYTAGFSPRPRIAFGFALPTGAESVAEYVDIALDPNKEHELVDLVERLSPAMPAGIDVTGASLLEPSTPALQAAVVASSWEIVTPEGSGDLEERVARLLAQDNAMLDVERKGRLVPSDIRPGIHFAEVRGHAVVCELAARGTRPADFVRALGCNPLDSRFLRTHQWIDHAGGRAQPLAAGAALPGEVLREEPTAHVRPQPFSALGTPPAPARLARGA